MSRAASGPHPHPLALGDLPSGDVWAYGCRERRLPIQGGTAGLIAHRRTVHTHRGDPRLPITVDLQP